MLEEFVEEFLNFIVCEKGLSNQTRLAYREDLHQLNEFLKRKHPNCTLSQLGQRELKTFIANLKATGLSPRSIARKISAVKQFYGYLLRENRVKENPAALISVRVKKKTLPHYLSVDEMVKLLEAARGESEEEIRDRAILEMWYATGARITELLSIQTSHLDWDSKLVLLRGKGNRERLVPCTESAIEWVRKYYDIRHQWIRRHFGEDEGALFLTRLGKPFSRQGLWKLLKKYALEAHLSKKIWPHLIRHTFATHLIQNGADLRVVQELLGHRSITTTEIYTHLSPENLRLMQLKYHPRA